MTNSVLLDDKTVNFVSEKDRLNESQDMLKTKKRIQDQTKRKFPGMAAVDISPKGLYTVNFPEERGDEEIDLHIKKNVIPQFYSMIQNINHDENGTVIITFDYKGKIEKEDVSTKLFKKKLDKIIYDLNGESDFPSHYIKRIIRDLNRKPSLDSFVEFKKRCQLVDRKMYYNTGVKGTMVYEEKTNARIAPPDIQGWMNQSAEMIDVQIESDPQVRESYISELKSMLEKFAHFKNPIHIYCLIGWIIVALIHHKKTKNFILNCIGPYQSGKTELLRCVQQIVDRSGVDVIEMDNLKSSLNVLSGQPVIAYDNNTRTSKRDERTLCVVGTGGSIPHRKFYSNDGLLLKSYDSSVCYSSLTPVSSAEDLLSRHLILEVLPIPQELLKTVEDLNSEFDKLHSKMLSAFIELTLISNRLARKDTDQYKAVTRQVYAEKITYYAAETLNPGIGEKVREAFDMQKTDNMDFLIDDCPLVTALHEFLKDKDSPYEIKLPELYSEIQNAGKVLKLDLRSPSIPSSSNALTRKLNKHKNLLQRVGIEFEAKRTMSKRFISFTHNLKEKINIPDFDNFEIEE